MCAGALCTGIVLDGAGSVAHQHFGLMSIERGTVHRPVRAVVVGQALVGGEPGAIAVDALDLAEEVAGQAAVFLQEVVPVTSVVAARAEVGGDPQDLVHVADRRRDLVNQALILHHHHFGFAIGIVVVFPALGLHVVLKHPASPDRVIDLVLGGTNGVSPDFVHGGVAVVEQRPLPGARVQAAGAGGSRRPHEVARHRDPVDDVVA